MSELKRFDGRLLQKNWKHHLRVRLLISLVCFIVS